MKNVRIYLRSRKLEFVKRRIKIKRPPPTSNSQRSTILRPEKRVSEPHGFLAHSTIIQIMVGVPGRSKACVTCRKRRKGCDFGRPSCAQCKKHGLECGGCENQRVFVVSTPDVRQPGYSVPPSTVDSSGTSSSQKQRFSGLQSWSRARLIKTDHRRQSHNHATSTATNFQQLSRPEDERRCIDLFWKTYFPSGRPIPHSVIRSYTCTWTETAQNTWQDDDSLRYALWANSLLMMGRQHKEEWMVRESSKMYGRALENLRKSLSMSHSVKKEASIATVKLLSMFEALVHQQQDPSPPNNWQRHNSGELALFVARKPEAHEEGDAHHIFADERVEMALSSILQRKRLVLGDPAWKTVPWQLSPKNLKDVLVDVLVDMPGLVEDFDHMMRHFHQLEMSSASLFTRQSAAMITATTLCEELLQKCWEYDRHLLDWSHLVLQLPRQPPSVTSDSTNVEREKKEGRKSGCQPPPRTDINKTSQDSPDIDQQALVIQIAQVHGMSLYWTTSLVLYTILQAALNLHASFELWPAQIPVNMGSAVCPLGQGMSLLHDRLNPLSHAKHLVGALSILLQPSAGLYAQRSAALPLEVALEYVGGRSSRKFGSFGIDANVEVSGSQLRNLHGVPWGYSHVAESRNGISGEKIFEKLKKLKEQLNKGFS
ncbi:Sterigmatocystin biosynthesis regulatory protein [Rhypophila sp. PSN 637]